MISLSSSIPVFFGNIDLSPIILVIRIVVVLVLLLFTAVHSVALVCELNTHSLPSSFHIPSIMSSQSLLRSRDGVFKKIKDVGEDFAISLVYLLQGDMDNLPLSFHASLEEQWDNEEETEEI
ncbi:hypothetical protein O181_037378 [Austropuccinia psidii MF-1]|uniref:Uncharacterized protein n=1 Tax=Austropuccinia psidii MF-1 TaxID=1389203 RepID=A0A9Q3HA17_9BASI|nr:hypothetical protein [Austropuccinia psidii MF-1]